MLWRLGQQAVLWLDVAVHDAQAVKVRNSIHHLQWHTNVPAVRHLERNNMVEMSGKQVVHALCHS